MAHAPTRDLLISLANNNTQNPEGFLEGLSDIHIDWHSQNQRSYGFLLFHHRVVRYFQNIVNSQLDNPIVAFTATEFRDMGAQTFNGSTANVDTLGELASFSAALENWHNTAHMIIGNATQTPMMDPRQNIFFRPFWQLHFYIDNLFQTVLQQYGNRAHPNQFLNVSAVASHIEASHHSWVSRI